MKNKIYTRPVISLETIVLETCVAASSAEQGTDYLYHSGAVQYYEYEALEGESNDFFIN